MSWSALVLIATALIGVGSLVEKQLVSRYLPNAGTFLGWLALSMLPHAVVMAPLYPVPEGVEFRRVLAMLVAGALWGVAGNLMYRALQRGEASRVWPVLNVAPVWVAIMAVFLLDEALSTWQWLAIVVAVLGTVLISLQRSGDGRGFRLNVTFAMLIIASLFMAVGQILSKYGLEQVPVLTGFWLMRFGMFVALAINLRGENLRNMAASTRRPMAFGLVLVVEMALFPATILMVLKAISIGPISLVATVMGTVPVWVFVLSTLLSTRYWNVMNEPLNKETLALKAVAVALIVGGVSTMTLV